jgi:hypothetical protein
MSVSVAIQIAHPKPPGRFPPNIVHPRRPEPTGVGQPGRNPPKPVQIYSAGSKAEEGGPDGPSQGLGSEVAVDLANRDGEGGPGEDGEADGGVRTGFCRMP